MRSSSLQIREEEENEKAGGHLCPPPFRPTQRSIPSKGERPVTTNPPRLLRQVSGNIFLKTTTESIITYPKKKDTRCKQSAKPSATGISGFSFTTLTYQIL